MIENKQLNSMRTILTYTDYPEGGETLAYDKEQDAYVLERWVSKDAALAWLDRHSQHFGEEYFSLRQKIISIAPSALENNCVVPSVIPTAETNTINNEIGL